MVNPVQLGALRLTFHLLSTRVSKLLTAPILPDGLKEMFPAESMVPLMAPTGPYWAKSPPPVLSITSTWNELTVKAPVESTEITISPAQPLPYTLKYSPMGPVPRVQTPALDAVVAVLSLMMFDPAPPNGGSRR